MGEQDRAEESAKSQGETNGIASLHVAESNSPSSLSDSNISALPQSQNETSVVQPSKVSQDPQLPAEVTDNETASIPDVTRLSEGDHDQNASSLPKEVGSNETGV